MTESQKTGEDLKNWSMPLPPEILKSSGWGADRSYRGNENNPHPTHKGVDLHAPLGSPVKAIGDGKVFYTQDGWKPGNGKAGGNAIYIDHPGGIRSEYMHLSEISVKPGQKVEGGQVIGKSGTTGGERAIHSNAQEMAPHLHLQIRVNGQLVNPMDFVRSTSGEKQPSEANPSDMGTSKEAVQKEGDHNIMPADRVPNFSSSDGKEIYVNPNGEPNQSVNPGGPNPNQSNPMSGLGTPIDSGYVYTPGIPDAGSENQENVDAGVPQSGAADQPDMDVNISTGPISLDPGSNGPISYDPGQIKPGQSDELNASFEPNPPDMGAFIPTPYIDYNPYGGLDRTFNDPFTESEGLGPIPIGIGGVESAAEGTLEPLGHEIVAIAIEKVVEDGVEAYKTWSENQSENEPEIFPNAMSFDPGMSYDPGPISDPDMPIELFSTSEPGNTSEPSTSVAARDAYTSGTPDAGPEYQENSDADVPDSNNFDGGNFDANAPSVEQPFDPNMSIDPGQYASTDSNRSYDNTPSMDIPGELNQSIAPPESNQSVAPSELKQGSIPPELNQSIQPPEVNQSVASPELNQSIQPPEVNQSLASPDSGYDTDSSSTEGYDSRSSDAGGYDGAYPNASGYDSGGSDAGGYDAGSSDAKGASEGSGEADPNRG